MTRTRVVRAGCCCFLTRENSSRLWQKICVEDDVGIPSLYNGVKGRVHLNWKGKFSTQSRMGREVSSERDGPLQLSPITPVTHYWSSPIWLIKINILSCLCFLSHLQDTKSRILYGNFAVYLVFSFLPIITLVITSFASALPRGISWWKSNTAVKDLLKPRTILFLWAKRNILLLCLG